MECVPKSYHVAYTSTDLLSSPTSCTVQPSTIYSSASAPLGRLVLDTDDNQLSEHWRVTQSMVEMPGSCMTCQAQTVRLCANSMQAV